MPECENCGHGAEDHEDEETIDGRFPCRECGCRDYEPGV